jgi:outer membrane protein TolC
MMRTWTVLGIAVALVAGCRGPLGSLALAPTLRPIADNAIVSQVQHTEDLPPPANPPPADKAPAQKGPAGDSPQPAPEPLQPAPVEMAPPPPQREPGEAESSEQRPLSLAEVTESVYFAYPGLEAALRELEIAAGKEQATLGEFDLKLKAGSQSDALGFYQTYKNAVKLEQAMWNGGGVYGQYRLGRGNFPTWDGLETNDGGEFKVGFLRPLLQNAAIDRRRADVLQATLRRQQVDPAVQALLLELVRDAADAYWSWVAAGRAYGIQRDLLRITVERNKVYEGRVAAGDLPRIELVQNQRLIAAREAKLVETERKLQQSAIKLSLYLRDAAGQPLIPSGAMLPATFPGATPPDIADRHLLIVESLASRPELRELDIVREQVEVDLSQAQNMLLPDLTATLDAAKDIGAPTPKGDKTPFQLQAGLYFEVPLERNKAQGKIRELSGKLAQIAAKRRLLENKITIEVQDALSALATSHTRYLRARENTELAWQLVTAERQRFESQDSDLFRVALQETAAIEASLGEIDALSEFFKAQAAYRAAIAQPPLANGG